MWLIWMSVILFWGDHGSMIDMQCMMATSTHIVMKDGQKFVLNPVIMEDLSASKCEMV